MKGFYENSEPATVLLRPCWLRTLHSRNPAMPPTHLPLRVSV
jgi:hypothetical protein